MDLAIFDVKSRRRSVVRNWLHLALAMSLELRFHLIYLKLKINTQIESICFWGVQLETSKGPKVTTSIHRSTPFYYLTIHDIWSRSRSKSADVRGLRLNLPGSCLFETLKTRVCYLFHLIAMNSVYGDSWEVLYRYRYHTKKLHI